MLNNGTAKIEKVFNSLSISIPSKKNWTLLIIAPAWLFGWFFGFKNASTTLLSENGNAGSDGFLTVSLVGWTVGGFSIIFFLLWGFFGKEKFVLENGEVSFEKSIFGIGQKKKLQANEVKNFRIEFNTEDSSRNKSWNSWGLGPGKIKFDYGLKTFSFGLGLDDAEANHIVSLLKEHFKN